MANTLAYIGVAKKCFISLAPGFSSLKKKQNKLECLPTEILSNQAYCLQVRPESSLVEIMRVGSWSYPGQVVLPVANTLTYFGVSKKCFLVWYRFLHLTKEQNKLECLSTEILFSQDYSL